MKHSGKALRAALRIIFWTLVLLLAFIAAGALARFLGDVVGRIAAGLVTLWALFVAFTLYFFRDPDPHVPPERNAIVSPGHGKVDMIDQTTEPEFMGGPCQRVSIFLSVIDVHVQKAPVSGRLVYHRHKDGEFLSATRTDCGEHNENVLLGFVPSEYPDKKLGLRLIAGLIARRIIVWAQTGETIPRSERISLIQFGSRCDVYLPLDAKLHVKLGDKVKGGESIVASFA
jgi:phosphatidylserine decarboxylase